MSSSGRRGRRLPRCLLAAAVVLTVSGLGLPAAGAAPETPRTYVGPSYDPELDTPPTQGENQSKLWFHADAWWALMLEPTGRTVRVFELMPDHSWRPTSAVVNTDIGRVGDALREGDEVHVVTRLSTGRLSYVHLTFDPEERDYRVATPQLVTERGGKAAAAITQDVTGRLWVGYAHGLHVGVMYSDDGRTWSKPVKIARTGDGSVAEVGAIVAYDDRVGIMWSQQATGAFRFASHGVEDAPDVWSIEEALIGRGEADNHISLVRVPEDGGDTLIAAVKTSKGDEDEGADEILVKLLIRSPDGDWSQKPAARVGDALTDPLLQVDLTNRMLYLFAAASSGDIVEKRTSLDDLRFRRGLGDLFMLGADGRLLDPTGSKEPVDAESGLVVLASDAARKGYRHAEMDLGGRASVSGPEDTTPPSPPPAVRARAVSPESVVLSWTPATDGDRWVPAGTGVPVASYVVTRDGVDIATGPATSLRDSPRAGPARDELTVEYQVSAVDQAGNRSAPNRVIVVLPAPPSHLPLIIGVASLVLAGIGGAFAAYRLRRTQRELATALPASTPSEEPSELPDSALTEPGARSSR